MVSLNLNRCGRSEASDENGPNMGNHNHVLDRLRPNDNILSLTSHHHGPPHHQIIPDPSRIPHRLLRSHHPPNRGHLRSDHRPHLPQILQQSSRPHPPPKNRGRPSVVDIRHAGGRPDRNQEITRSTVTRVDPSRAGNHRPAKRVLAGPTVRPGGVGGGVYVYGAARFFPEGMP